MLLRKFGASYPPSAADEKAYLGGNKAELGREALETLEEPLRQAGLDTASLRLGTMFTSGGSSVIPGTKSYATPREPAAMAVAAGAGTDRGRVGRAWS